MILTNEEEKAIAAFKRLAKRWPKSLWLYSGSGTLHVMKRDYKGNIALNESGNFDQNYSVDSIEIHNDGGDW